MIKSILLSVILWSFPNIMENLVSKVYHWQDLFETKSLQGTEKAILAGSTPVFSNIEVRATTLVSRNKKTFAADKYPGYEKLMIVKEGVLDFVINGARSLVEEGGVVLVCPDDEYVIINNFDKPVTWYTFRWKTRTFPPEEKLNKKSVVFQWDDLAFLPSEKGGRRNVMQRATAQLNELEIHVTTLKAGLPSHAAHTHPDDEFILVKTGNVEMSVSGILYKAGAGSLYFLKGEDPHGIRNIGDVACEYYAIRFK